MLQFKFAPKPITVKRNRDNSNTKKRISKLLQGDVFIEDEVYKIKISITSGNYRILDFTEESFDLKGKTNIFSKCKTNEDKRTRYIRQEIDSRVHPGDKNKYVPFAPNWTVSGYIISFNKKELFDFNDIVCPVGRKLYDNEYICNS